MNQKAQNTAVTLLLIGGLLTVVALIALWLRLTGEI